MIGVKISNVLLGLQDLFPADTCFFPSQVKSQGGENEEEEEEEEEGEHVEGEDDGDSVNGDDS